MFDECNGNDTWRQIIFKLFIYFTFQKKKQKQKNKIKSINHKIYSQIIIKIERSFMEKPIPFAS